MKQLLELPLNLSVVSPADTPNWDLVSDVVNSCSRIYRSSKQCRTRYENVIIPREEGKVSLTWYTLVLTSVLNSVYILVAILFPFLHFYLIPVQTSLFYYHLLFYMKAAHCIQLT